MALDGSGGVLMAWYDLVSGVQPAGERVVRWDGRDEGGAWVSTGVYFLRLHTGPTTLTKRIAVVH
jgi:hypothetical protein